MQDARRAAGLDVSDRIATTVLTDADSVAAILAHRELLQRETLSVHLDVREAPQPLPTTPPSTIGPSGTAWIEVRKA